METRTVDQVKVFVLRLNPVTAAAQVLRPVMCATSVDALKARYGEEKAPEHYTDTDGYHKTFKKDGLLEMYNGIGVAECWWDPTNWSNQFNPGVMAHWVNIESIINGKFERSMKNDGFLFIDKDLVEAKYKELRGGEDS